MNLHEDESHLVMFRKFPPKTQKSYFQNLNQNWPTLLEIENSVSCNPHKQSWFFSSHIVIRGQQPRNHLTLVQLSAMRCGRHCLHNFCHIRYSLPHTHDVCTYSKSGDAPPSFANSLWRYHHQKVCCRIIRRTILLFIIWNICNKENMFQNSQKTTWTWGGNSLMSPVSGRGLANKDICLPLRLGIRWLDGKLEKNRLII